jgi:transcriptional regulator with XRE-family HTH domain
MSQEKFAEKLGGRINKGMVSKWERGVDEPMGPAVARLLQYAASRGVGLSSMTVMELQLLEHFRSIPDEGAKLRALAAVIKEAALFSQPEAAREPKA